MEPIRPPRVQREAVFQPNDPNIRLIPLTRSQVAIVDAAYFETHGHLNWCAQWSPAAKAFYAMRRENGKAILMHREVVGAKPREHVDHRNLNTLDNRDHNLRKCTKSQNNMNRKLSDLNSTGFVGVRYIKDLDFYRAYISVKRKQIHLGCFTTAKEAAIVRDAATRKYYGEFGRYNFPQL